MPVAPSRTPAFAIFGQLAMIAAQPFTLCWTSSAGRSTSRPVMIRSLGFETSTAMVSGASSGIPVSSRDRVIRSAWLTAM